MKKEIPGWAIGLAALLALALVGFFFVKGTGDPAPTVTNLPDYSKMSAEDVTKAREESDAAAAAAMSQGGR